MAFDQRNGTCETCGGPIYRYPKTWLPENDPDRLGAWAHTRFADIRDNPHDPIPKDTPE